MPDYAQRTTIGLKQRTKTRLDRHRAPGQSYEGFMCQMLDLWEASAEHPLGRRTKKPDSGHK